MATPGKNRTIFQSFYYAISGICHTVRHERNMKSHLAMSIGVVALSFLMQLNALEWIAISLCIGLVLGMELMNTAVEHTVDLIVEDQYHELAKHAKDTAAGAVFVAALIAVVVGAIIFVPKFWAIVMAISA